MVGARQPGYVLTFTAEDRVGIVAATSGSLAARDGLILDSQQYADVETGRFFTPRRRCSPARSAGPPSAACFAMAARPSFSARNCR